jgi:hypothetical protein
MTLALQSEDIRTKTDCLLLRHGVVIFGQQLE